MARAVSGKKKTSARLYIFIVIALLMVVMVFQLVSLSRKQKSYSMEEKNLRKELAQEKVKSEELKDYEAYTKTEEYIENMARMKGGLVKENEIVFREGNK